MHFLIVLSSIGLALTSITQASPIERQVEARQTTAPAKFYLQTQVVPGGNDTGTDKNGLFLFSYHTGAGLGIAAAENSNPNGTYFYLNGTELLWTYSGSPGPWPVSVVYGPYQSFNPISISIAGPAATPGYSVNATGLQSDAAVGGWLACDWWYASPQIFADAGYQNRLIPSSCSKINLVPVAADE